MTTRTKAPANGQATAEDVAQSEPQRMAVPEPLARRIAEKDRAVYDAKVELSELVTLARELAGLPEAAQLRPVPGGGLVWVLD